MEILEENKKRIGKVLFILLVLLCVYFAVQIFRDIKETNMLGQSTEPTTISFSGHGEVTAKPDIATIYFSISKDAATVKSAQDAVAVIEKKALDFLKTKNIDDKDIKTSNASFNPKYEYKRTLCPQIGGVEAMYDCGNGKQVLVGYTASESITVKVRDTGEVGAIMQGLGTTGVSDLNGPNFAIENEDLLKAKARKEAIDDARQKAQILADDLGVSLVKISGFSENGGGYPYPMMYEKAIMSDSVAGAPAVIPTGENTISSDVTITYEIR